MNLKLIFIKFTLLILFFLVSCTPKVEGVTNISSKDLKSVLENNNIQLVDVRTTSEYNSGHIKGSKHINLFDDSFDKKSSESLKKDEPVYVYCKSGGRSMRAAKILKEKGFSKIYNLDGGISGWKSNNFELE